MTQHLKLVSAVAIAMGLGFGTAAHAESGRFQMEKTEGGYVRLDTKTGELSICTIKDDQIVCKTGADERVLYEDQLAELEKRIAKLEASASVNAGVPSEDEFEKSMDYMERFFDRFMGVIDRMEGEKDTRT